MKSQKKKKKLAAPEFIDLIRGGGIGNASREPIGLVIRRAGAGVLSHVLLSHLPET